uniref:Uncharacterized protein n=1 Tax=Anguilla anguilla TaxID=7936 RepID=A0A0E9Q4C0_ANGAN
MIDVKYELRVIYLFMYK